jgi:NADH:ubiquinone oxidoreductase subunit 2 (subunit N)
MSAPVYVLVAPPILALIFFPIRRWPKVSGAAAAVAVWLFAIVLLGIDLDPLGANAEGILNNSVWSALGQSFVLSDEAQLLLVAAYLLIGLAFLLSTFYPQSSIFVVLTLLVMSPLSGALLVEPDIYGAVLLVIAACGLAILVQGRRAGSTLGALRFISLYALAMPLLLGARWMFESDQFRYLDTVTLIFIAVLLLLTASFPFQIWVAPVVSESSSFVPSIVYGVGQMLVIVFCLSLLLSQPFVYRNVQFQQIANLSAAATLILGATLAITARSFGRQLGYLLLLSIGAVIAIIGSGGSAVVQATLTLMILRIIALIIAGAGLAMIRSRAVAVDGGVNQFAANRGLAWQSPTAVGLFVFGCLSLAGLPLTPGFAGTWPAVEIVGQQSTWLAVIMVLSIAVGAFGVLRRLMPLLVRADPASGEHRGLLENRREQLVSGTILLAGAILALFPRLILTFVNNLADLF